ncbi:MAG: helix-turn-helix transcriptional regulator [Fibrobacterota bacterium]
MVWKILPTLALVLFLLGQPCVGRSLSEPKPYSVFTSNVIRLKTEFGPGENIKEVRYFASYWEATGFKATESRLIGLSKEPPFSYYWDVSGLPDQDMWRMSLYCDIVFSSGKIDSGAKEPTRFVVLDRDREPSRPSMDAEYAASMDAFLAGRLESISPITCGRFLCGDNPVLFKLFWSAKGLGLYLKVRDIDPDTTYRYSSWPAKGLIEKDFIALYLDIRNRRGYFLDTNTRVFQFAPSGRAHIIDPKLVRGFPDTLGRLKVFSSLGFRKNDAPLPPAYELFAFCPAEELGFTPAAGDTVGFNLFSLDFEGQGPGFVTGTWAGLPQWNVANPRKWGNLMFTPRSSSWKKAVFVLIPLLLLIASTATLFRRRARKEAPPGTQDPLIQKVVEHVQKNFKENALTLEATASHFNISKSYLGKLFTKSMDMTFSVYLNNIRIAEAKKLLRETNENVTQIGYAVGYDSFDTFLSAFKRIARTTPSQFRKEEING